MRSRVTEAAIRHRQPFRIKGLTSLAFRTRTDGRATSRNAVIGWRHPAVSRQELTRRAPRAVSSCPMCNESSRPERHATTCKCAVAAVIALLMPLTASAQELEPGAYWPIPKGLNIVTVVNSFNWGDLAFDPAAPIDEASARINTTALAFTRAFSLAGRSANVGVVGAGHRWPCGRPVSR